MSMLPPILVELKASSSEFMAKMGEARHEVGKLSTESASHFEKFSAVGKAALFGIAGAAVAIGGMAVKAAIDGEAAHARLAQAVKNTGGSMEELEPKVGALADKFARLGYTNDELESGLANMTTALRDPEKAMGAMGLAADLARYKHIDLADASTIVAKAMEGQLKPLKALGIDLPVAAGGALKLEQAHAALAKAQAEVNRVLKEYPDAADAASKHHKEYESATRKVTDAQAKLTDVQGTATEITKGLSEAVGGQAAAASATFAGKLQTARAQAENLAEKLGMHLLPVITNLVGKISDVVSWFEKHTTTAKILAGVVGGVLVAAIAAYVGGLIYAAATSATAFVTMLLGSEAFFAEQEAGFAKSLAGMIRWVASMVAQAAVATASMLASFAEQAAGAAVWAADMLVAGATALLPFLPLIAICAAVAFAAYELYKHWDDVWGFIKKITGAAVDFIKEHAKIIVGAIFLLFPPLGLLIAAIHLVWTHWDQIWGAIKTATSAAWGFLKPIFNAIVDVGLAYIKTELTVLRTVWHAVWGAISAATTATWHVLKPVFDALLTGGIWYVKKEAQVFKAVWDGVWGGIQAVVKAAWDFLKPIFDNISKGVGGIVSAAGKVTGVVGKVGGALGFNADGTDYWRGGPTWVGERGPEIVNLPRGSRVTSNEAIRAGGGGGGGGDQTVHLVVNLDGRVIAETTRTHLLRLKQDVGSVGLA